MRTCVLALAALVAASPAHAGKAYNWSGIYFGAHVGGAWGDAVTRDDIADFAFDVDGVFGGGTAGINLQFGSIVLGPEIDIGYLDLSGGRRTDSSNPTKFQTLDIEGGSYVLLGGRAGMAFGETLLYGKGGWVWYGTDSTQTTTNPGYVTNGTGSFDGWALGGGLEQALGGGWSLKAEYMHFGFGAEQGDQTSVSDPPIGHVYEFTTDLDAETVKLGINYNFSYALSNP